MRSLALKLTLAFLLVGLMGSVLMAVFLVKNTQREFDKFVSNQDQFSFTNQLAQHYQTTGSWEGVEEVFNRGRFRAPGPAARTGMLVLVNADGIVLVSGGRYKKGMHIKPDDHTRAAPIEIEDEVVGWLLMDQIMSAHMPGSPEEDFLKRMNQAIVYSALAAITIALLIGILLARTISRPIRELTDATQVVASGELGHRVPVRTRDEIGELAASFNQMSADLAHSNQIRRQMTADIAHDLRTPLSVLLGYTEAFLDGKLEGTPETYKVMHAEAQHLNYLIEDLRTLSLADSGELTLSRKLVDPGVLLERTASAHRTAAKAKGITLQTSIAGDLPEIELDADRMAQVLGNLINNALQFTPEGGEIKLSAASEANDIVLCVQDNGPGIPTEDLPFIFERFYKGDKSRSDAGASGLGLGIARSLVEAHGATIAVESAPGEGTTFIIRLPIEK
jgi:signal transduction histidine kinase